MRMYRKVMVKCRICHGDGYLPLQDSSPDGSHVLCGRCSGDGFEEVLLEIKPVSAGFPALGHNSDTGRKGRGYGSSYRFG